MLPKWHRALALSFLVVSLMAGCARRLRRLSSRRRAIPITFSRLCRRQIPIRRGCFESMTPRGDGFRRAISRARRRGFAAVLKRSPAFYPSETALGYLELARKNFEAAAQRFDRVLQARAGYVPALVGRGEALLALSREPEALAAFESALKLDPQLQAIARRVEVLRARAMQENVAAARSCRAGGPARRSGATLRAGDRGVAGQRVSRARSCRGRSEAGKNGSGARALPARVELDPTDARRESASARFSKRAAISKAPWRCTTRRTPWSRARICAGGWRRSTRGWPISSCRLNIAPFPSSRRSRAAISRRSSASGWRALVQRVPAQPVVITDARNHWASEWIMATAGAGVMEPYENHTFQPRNAIQRSDLAQAVAGC